MGLVSIEEAVLGFVRKIKDDPGLTDLARAAAHELEVLLDPQAAEQQAPAEPVAETPVPEDGQPAEGQSPEVPEPAPGG